MILKMVLLQIGKIETIKNLLKHIPSKIPFVLVYTFFSAYGQEKRIELTAEQAVSPVISHYTSHIFPEHSPYTSHRGQKFAYLNTNKMTWGLLSNVC